MKKITLLLMMSMLLVTFSSCKKEGVYNPKEKISKIYEDYGYSKMLSEIWEWDKKQLKRIDHCYDGLVEWTEDFSYNEKGQIARVDCYEDEEYAIYQYDGKKLSKVSYYYEGELESEYIIKHNGKKISEIEMKLFYIDWKGRSNSRLMSEGYNPIKMLLSENAYASVRKISNDYAEISRWQDPTPLSFTIKLEWEKDNVSKIETAVSGLRVSIEYAYDNKSNPFANFFSIYFEDVLDYNSLSKNNVTEIRYTEIEDGYTDVEVERYSYSYDGKFPVEKRDDYSNIYYYEYE